ncbi:hypothetical protein [Sphingomonas sp. GB1N7]|uniref:hypothetical protein n=1 Tax=Parasphingomonas caseinilytica TaxID=3096158 RepID=UPI002FC98D1A
MGTLASVSNDLPEGAAPAVSSVAVDSRDVASVPVVESPVVVPATAVAPKPPVNVVTIVTAIAILALFAWLFAVMLDRAVPSKDWDRYLALYNSVQSIVAAAVGALMGAQVSAGLAVVARAEGAASKQRVERLEGNIKSFQADVVNGGAASESGDLTSRTRLLARAIALLH